MAASSSALPSLALQTANFITAIVHLRRHRERLPVLPTMRQRVPRRIGKAAGRAMHHFGHHRERPDDAGTDPRHQ